ncbi:MAG: NAD-dependent epimerase/dehydratase family protein [Sandaracinaceae bacterium]
MAKILITGGAGNIGSALASRLSASPEHEVVVVDNLSTGSMSKLPVGRANLRFVRADVNDIHAVTSIVVRHAPEYVFHYAAVVGVQRTLQNPIAVLNDIKGIQNILELAKNTGVKKVFYSSSSEVYGEPVEMPQREDVTPLNARLPYAVVKNIGECFCRSYRQEHGLEFVIFRFFNTYGPNQTPDFVLPRFLQKALRGEPIGIYGDGSQTRTFCYVDDNVDACVAAMTSEACEGQVINIGSDVEMSILDLARLVIARTGSRSRIEHLPPLPEGDMRRRCPDVTKMKQLLGRPLITVEEGIDRMIAHYRAAG